MLTKIHTELGVPSSYASDTGLPIYEEPEDLVFVGADIFRPEQRLVRPPADHWKGMQSQAVRNDITFPFFSFHPSCTIHDANLRQSAVADCMFLTDRVKPPAASGQVEPPAASRVMSRLRLPMAIFLPRRHDRQFAHHLPGRSSIRGAPACSDRRRRGSGDERRSLPAG